MNRYGRLAMSHWKQWAPARYAAIPDPPMFFSTLGQQVEARIQELTAAAPAPQGEYLQAVGELNMSRLVAEEQALAELVYVPVEEQTAGLEDEDDSLDLVTSVHQALDQAYREDSDSQD